MYDAPLDRDEPPVDAAYQSMVQPVGALAENSALLVPQYSLLLGLLGADGLTVTVLLCVFSQPPTVARTV